MNDTYVTIRGWVGTDVTMNQTPDGVRVANFRVGSTPRRRRADGEWENGTTSWFTVKAWRTLAEHVLASVRQGQAVLVHGRLEAEVWDREDGTRATRYVITASTVGHDLTRGTAQFSRPSRPGDGDRDAAPQAAEAAVDDEVPAGVTDDAAWATPGEPAA